MEIHILLLYLPCYSCTQSQESGERLSNQDLRFSDTAFPGEKEIFSIFKEHLKTKSENERRFGNR